MDSSTGVRSGWEGVPWALLLALLVNKHFAQLCGPGLGAPISTEDILALSRKKMPRNNHSIKRRAPSTGVCVEAGAAEYDKMERSPGNKGSVGSDIFTGQVRSEQK